MINTPGQSEKWEKKNYWIPTNDVEAMILTEMTRDRDEWNLINQNAYFHGNFKTTINMPKNPIIVDIWSWEWRAIEALNQYLRFLNPKTYGVDIYIPQEKNMQTNFIYQDLRNWLFLPEYADRVYSRYTLQYLPNGLNIIQDAYNQTNTYEKKDNKKAIGMFHLWPIYKNKKWEKIKPLSYELEQRLNAKNKWCNIRIFDSTDKFIKWKQTSFAGQFLAYEKNDNDSQFIIPDNIIAEKWNMYDPDIRNSEKFINFRI
jgi:hypothetical protein